MSRNSGSLESIRPSEAQRLAGQRHRCLSAQPVNDAACLCCRVKGTSRVGGMMAAAFPSEASKRECFPESSHLQQQTRGGSQWDSPWMSNLELNSWSPPTEISFSMLLPEACGGSIPSHAIKVGEGGGRRRRRGWFVNLLLYRAARKKKNYVWFHGRYYSHQLPV